MDGSTPAASGIGTSAVDSCPSPTPPYVCIQNGRIRDIGQNTTPNFRETIEFHTSIDRRLSSYYNVSSIVSQILRDELSISSSMNLYSRYRMYAVAETIQTMGPQLVSHGLPTIDTLNEKSGIWIPTTSAIRRITNTTHGRASEHVLRKGTLV